MRIEHLPTDLILDIISRLPSKSVARCRCVSKQWASLLALGSPYFTELFLTRSKTRPQLLFAINKNNIKWVLYSCPQPQISYKNSQSSLSVTAEFHMSLPKAWNLQISQLSGLIYCPNTRDKNDHKSPVLCNPSTGQILWLPKLKGGAKWAYSYFGYDLIDKELSVLSISSPEELPSNCFQILKIGSEKQLFWRNLECPLQHIPSYINTNVNGVLYYVANLGTFFPNKIVCFDYKSEEFKFIDEPRACAPSALVNFKGKLCGIYTKWVEFGERYNLELSLWILEDFEKQEWSQHSYNMSSSFRKTHVYEVGVSVTGDIVLSFIYTKPPYYVYFFNPEKNTLQEVEIKGFEEYMSNVIYAFSVDYVEDLRLFLN